MIASLSINMRSSKPQTVLRKALIFLRQRVWRYIQIAKISRFFNAAATNRCTKNIKNKKIPLYIGRLWQ